MIASTTSTVQITRKPSTLHRAARAYAEQFNWPVFPLAPREKTPLISKVNGGRGFHDATTDSKQIDKWFQQWPQANIGIAMGAGLWALDIDPRAEGDHNLAALLDQYGTLPETVEALTGGGGQHFLMRGDVGSGSIRPGVDFKGTGGYIVAAPSIHPSGRPYTWEASSRPGEVAIADAPKWLIDLLGGNQKKKAEHHVHEGSVPADTFALGLAFRAAGWLGRELRPGVFAVLCPNAQQHTGGEDFDSSTVIFAPAPGRNRGLFFCSHSHCKEIR